MNKSNRKYNEWQNKINQFNATYLRILNTNKNILSIFPIWCNDIYHARHQIFLLFDLTLNEKETKTVYFSPAWRGNYNLIQKLQYPNRNSDIMSKKWLISYILKRKIKQFYTSKRYASMRVYFRNETFNYINQYC